MEKEPNIGGKSILLSKVFPTLDCSSCIVTPKMVAAADHPQVTPMVYTEVGGFVREDAPLVGSLARACYALCEREGTET